MAPKPTQQQLAKDLFLQTDKTQQEIADILNVNRRTVYLWVKNGKWAEMKNAAAQTPFTMQSDIHNHISAINRRIKAREGDNCPTMQEVEMMRKLLNMSATINKFHTSAYIEAFEELTTYIFHQDVEFARKVTNYADSYIKGHLGNDNDEYERSQAETIARVEKNLENDTELQDPPSPPDPEPLTAYQVQNEAQHAIEHTTTLPATQIVTLDDNTTLSSVSESTPLINGWVGNNTLSFGEVRGEAIEGRVGNNTLSSGEGRGEAIEGRVGNNTLSFGEVRGEAIEGRVGNNTLSSGEVRGEAIEGRVGNNTLSFGEGRGEVSTVLNALPNENLVANEIKCDKNAITATQDKNYHNQQINNDLNQPEKNTHYPITNFSNNAIISPHWLNRSFIDHPANEVLGKG